MTLHLIEGERCTLSLASHYERIRDEHPDATLFVVFDIDGTILDTRRGLLRLLRAYDEERDTEHFAFLSEDDLGPAHDFLGAGLEELALPPHVREEVAQACREGWTRREVLESHTPFSGVLEVIRWFQLQPRTEVILNSGRPERLRAWTLRMLETLGRAHRVSFRSESLYLRPTHRSARQAKLETIRALRERGQVVAVVDDEVENLRAIGRQDPAEEILLLHADTILAARRRKIPRRAVRVDGYALQHLVAPDDLPRRVELVWRGPDLDAFYDSEVRRYELRASSDPSDLASACMGLAARGKALLLDLRRSSLSAREVLDTIHDAGLDPDDVDVLARHKQWFGLLAALREGLAGSVLQCAAGRGVIAAILEEPRKARRRLANLREAGIRRISLDGGHAQVGPLVDHLDAWGFEVHLRKITGLEAYLRGVLLQPTSITARLPF